MEHLLLALVSFVRSHLRLYHPFSVHHSYKAIFRTWKSLVSWIQDIISRDRERGTPFYFIDTCFADVQFRGNMIRILASTFLELKRQHPDEIRNLHDSKRFRRISVSLALYRAILPPHRRGRKFKNVEKCNVSGWKRIFL